MNKKIVSSIFLIITYLFSAYAQNNEGTPFIRNYETTEYGQEPNNWAIVQDKRGIMYFGNTGGVLTYDGVNWDIVQINNKSTVRSLAIDSSGTIYVGAVGDFGYLKTNQKGKLEYQSLVNQIPKHERDFADVWKTYATPEGIYFQTFTKIFRLKNNSFKIWKPTTSFHLSFYADNNFFVIEREQGLKTLKNDKLNLVKGGDFFSSLRIYAILPYSNNSLLIACREKGLFILNEKSEHALQDLKTESNNELINAQIYSGICLPSNTYCFSTLKNGVFIIDETGKIISHLNKQNGLLDDDVKYVALDNQNDLWMALGNGISRAEISSPLRFYGDAQGLSGSIEDINTFKNTLYVATSTGVYFLKEGIFYPVKNLSSAAWTLETVQNKDSILLVGCENGIYKIISDHAELINEGFTYKLKQSKKYSNRIYIGLNDGFASIRFEKNKWINEGYMENIETDIRAISEDNKGNLWLGTSFDGIIKVELEERRSDGLNNKKIKIIHYDTLSGLPNLYKNIPYNINGINYFATINGLYEFNENKNKFFHSSFLLNDLKDNQVFRMAQRNNNEISIFKVISSVNYELGEAILKNGKYHWFTKPFNRISEKEIHAILPVENGITWYGGPDGLIRYDKNKNKNFDVTYHSIIRAVKAGNKEIFNGNFFESDSTKFTIKQPESFVPVFNFSNNSMHFEYAAASYSNEKKNMYSIFLEGFDNGWSTWSTKFEKEYTNLKEGKYVFHVKAKNVYDTISSESTYAFEILPPWYRHTLAYVIYVILFFSVLFGFNAIRTRQLQQRQIKLQEKIEEATAEIKEQKHLIEEKHKEITDSINYAERIQRSFMATKKHLDEHLNNKNIRDTEALEVSLDTVASSASATNSIVTSSEVEKSTSSGLDLSQPVNNTDNYFIFFKPKDVVSGDFYWSATLNNGNFALVTADSTGHGVPGAIMSLLNITSLEKAIENSTAPSEILNHTRKIIIDRLKKDGSEDGGKDGMDCSLCIYDFKNRKLVLSAANNPVWIIRHAVTSSEVEKSTDRGLDSARPTLEVIEIKPDKMPVGKHDRQDQSFTEKEIDLQSGDIIYTLTDGFLDQFGGEKGKKFMSKNLRENLVSISQLPMSKQKINLEETFINWVGNLEQVDDVTIIGIKIQ